MTKEELQDILHVLGLDYEAEANQVYVFYMLPDGRVDNFSINIKRGRQMSGDEIVAAMRREYPSTRQCTVMSIDRPEGSECYREVQENWIEKNDACLKLKISKKTMKRWTDRGLLHESRIGRRVYYKMDEINAVLDSKIVQKNGRIDAVEAQRLMDKRGLMWTNVDK